MLRKVTSMHNIGFCYKDQRHEKASIQFGDDMHSKDNLNMLV